MSLCRFCGNKGGWVTKKNRNSADCIGGDKYSYICLDSSRHMYEYLLHHIQSGKGKVICRPFYNTNHKTISWFSGYQSDWPFDQEASRRHLPYDTHTMCLLHSKSGYYFLNYPPQQSHYLDSYSKKSSLT